MMNHIKISMLFLTTIFALNAGDIRRPIADLTRSPKIAASTSAISTAAAGFFLGKQILLGSSARRRHLILGGLISSAIALDCAYAAVKDKGLEGTFTAKGASALLHRIRGNKGNVVPAAPVEAWKRAKAEYFANFTCDTLKQEEVDQMGISLRPYHGVGEIIGRLDLFFVKQSDGNFRIGTLVERYEKIFLTRFYNGTVQEIEQANVYLPNNVILKKPGHSTVIAEAEIFHIPQNAKRIRRSKDRNGEFDGGLEYQITEEVL